MQRLVTLSFSLARAYQPLAADDAARFRENEQVQRFADSVIFLEDRISRAASESANDLRMHRKMLITELGALTAQEYPALAHHWLGPAPVRSSSLEFRLADFTQSTATPHELWNRTIGEIGIAVICGHQSALAEANQDFSVHPDYCTGELHHLIPRVRAVLAEYLSVESVEHAAQYVGITLTSEDEAALDL